MNDRERSILQSMLEAPKHPTESALVLLPSLVITLLFIGIPLFVQRWEKPMLDRWPVISIVLGCLLLFMFFFGLQCVIAWLLMYRDHRKVMAIFISTLRTTLEKGLVSVKRIEASAVAVLDGYEGRATGFLFELVDGKLYFLMGREYAVERVDSEWPNSKFEIVRDPTGSVLVGVFGHGAKLEPVAEIRATDLQDRTFWSRHEELVAGELHSFVQGLKK